MFDEYETLFSVDFMRKYEDMVIIKMLTNLIQDDEQKAMITKLFRAFTKRDIPARVVVEAFMEVFVSEGGFENG